MVYIPTQNYENQREKRNAAHKADMARRRQDIAALSAQIAANQKIREAEKKEAAYQEYLHDKAIDRELDREKKRTAARNPQREELERKALEALDTDSVKKFMDAIDEFDRSSETIRSHWRANNAIVPSLGHSIIREACSRGKGTIVKHLVETYRGDDGARWMGSIYEALPYCQPALLKEICSGALLCNLFVWAKENRPHNPDYCDVVPASIDIAATTELICSTNPSCLKETDSFGWNSCPIHCAVEYGHKEAIPVIMEYGGKEMANLRTQGNSKKTPLHFAASKGRAKYIPILVKYGADVNAVDSSGKTPLHVASTSDEEECVRFLMRLGADINRKDDTGRKARSYTSNLDVKNHLRGSSCQCSLQ